MNKNDWKLAQIKDFDTKWYFKKNRFALTNRADIVEHVLSLASPKHVLDIGTADGEIPLELVTTGKFDAVFVGIDLSISLIKIAVKTAKKKNLSETTQFLVADLEYLPFREEEFDFVVCTAVLEHVIDIHTAVRGMSRVCELSKLILITLPNIMFQKIFHLLAILHLRYKDSVYHSNRALEDLEKVMKKYNLLPIYRLNFVLPLPRSFKFMEKFIRYFKIKKIHLFLNQLLICKKQSKI